MVGVLILVAGLIAIGAAISLIYGRSKSSEPPIQQINGGWVIRNARRDDHFCDPPLSRGSNPNERSMNDFHDKWTPGDMWLCGCGRAWVVVPIFSKSSFNKWTRSEKDDVAVIDP